MICYNITFRVKMVLHGTKVAIWEPETKTEIKTKNQTKPKTKP